MIENSISPSQSKIINDIEKLLNIHDSLLPILQAIQNQEGYLPITYLKILATQSHYTNAHIQSVATFYHGLRLRPKGQYEIKICIGAACYVKGAERLYDAFKRYLHISDHNDTDEKGLFTVSKVACLGCCMLAPAVQIHNDIFGWVEVNDIETILLSFLESQSEKKEHSFSTSNEYTAEVRLCKCSSCAASGSLKVWDAFAKMISKNHFKVRLKEVSCTGKSYRAPYVQIIVGEQTFHYAAVQAQFTHRILSSHFLAKQIINKGRITLSNIIEKMIQPTCCSTILNREEDTLFESNQKRIVTENSGEVTPLDLDEYLEKGGFQSLKKVKKQTPQWVLSELEKSGLRGRGGGGFPTYRKWESAHNSHSDEKYLICNADEGDPGAFMDRMLLESFPFRVIEGMLIAAHVINAKKCIIYIREEYTHAVKTLQEAIAKIASHPQIQHDLTCEIKLFLGAGAFVCGEESALLESIEGRRGETKMRPPFPTEKGLFEKPTLINNVETYATIPWIIREGAEVFSNIGVSGSHGTKTFALAGKIKRGGLIEVPMGITIREIVEKIGGGVGEGRTAKAVQIGGPSGGCIPANLFDIQIDFDTLLTYGSMMGSGGLVVLDNKDCMVDIARYFLKFACDESCGKCTPCREGLPQLLALFDKIKEGENPQEILTQMYNIALNIQIGSLCGLGKTATNGVLTTLRYFQEEYLSHFVGYCPAGKCTEFTSFHIQPSRCIGCTKCAQSCAVSAIEFRPLQIHEIDSARCVKCGICRDVCPQKAISAQSKPIAHPAIDFDFTPAISTQMTSKSIFTIDDIECEIGKNETIWDVAKRQNIVIPKLCHSGGNHQPRCMICAVFDLKTGKMIPSCNVLANTSQIIEANSQRVKNFRKWVGYLLKNDSFGCKKCGKCLGDTFQFINRGNQLEIGAGFEFDWHHLDDVARKKCPYGVLEKRIQNV